MNPKYYPWLFVAFFGVIFTMNGIMVYFATTTFNGIAVEDAYEKGLKHNDKLAETEKKREQHFWLKDNSSYDSKSNSYNINVQPYQKANTIEVGSITVEVFRPTREGADLNIALNKSAGGYKESFTPPLPGLWELRYKVTLKDTEQTTFEYRKRVDLRPENIHESM